MAGKKINKQENLDTIGSITSPASPMCYEELCEDPFSEPGDTASAISGIHTTDLLDYMKMNEIVCDFYDNEMKANNGQYYGEEKARYDAAAAKLKKYLSLKDALLNEMERRLSRLC